MFLIPKPTVNRHNRSYNNASRYKKKEKPWQILATQTVGMSYMVLLVPTCQISKAYKDRMSEKLDEIQQNVQYHGKKLPCGLRFYLGDFTASSFNVWYRRQELAPSFKLTKDCWLLTHSNTKAIVRPAEQENVIIANGGISHLDFGIWKRTGAISKVWQTDWDKPTR